MADITDWIAIQYRKYPASSAIILAALVLIATLPFMITSQNESAAERIADYAYFFLVIGVLMRIINLKSKTLKKWLDAVKNKVIKALASFYAYCKKFYNDLMRTPNLKYKTIAVVTILTMLFIEYAVPLNFTTTLNPIPPEYQWLANQTGSFTIAEYPVIPEIYSAEPFNASDPYYIFYQQFHGKKLFNGAWNGVGKFVEQDVQNLSNPQTPQILAWYNVSYVIVHYPSNPYQPYQGLSLVEVFPNASVYKVTASPSIYWPYQLQQIEKNLKPTTLVP